MRAKIPYTASKVNVPFIYLIMHIVSLKKAVTQKVQELCGNWFVIINVLLFGMFWVFIALFLYPRFNSQAENSVLIYFRTN